MNKELLPYLKSLSGLLTTAANTRIDNEVASMHIDLSKRLVDLLLVQNKLPSLLETKFFNKLPEAVSKLAKVLPKSKNNKLLLNDLKNIPDLDVVNIYDQFLKIS